MTEVKKAIKLDAAFIKKVNEQEVYDEKEYKLDFITTKDSTMLLLTNGKKLEQPLSKDNRFLKDLSRLLMYQYYTLKGLRPLHLGKVLQDLKGTTAVCALKEGKMIGISRLAGLPEEEKKLPMSEILGRLVKAGDYFVRDHSSQEGIRSLKLYRDAPVELLKGDRWCFGPYLCKDEIADGNVGFKKLGFREICGNFLIGDRIPTFTRGEEALSKAIDKSIVDFKERIVGTYKIPIDNVNKRFGILMRKSKFGEGWEKVEIEAPNVYGIINAITKEAQTRSEGTALEIFAGRVAYSFLNENSDPVKKILLGSLN